MSHRTKLCHRLWQNFVPGPPPPPKPLHCGLHTSLEGPTVWAGPQRLGVARLGAVPGAGRRGGGGDGAGGAGRGRARRRGRRGAVPAADDGGAVAARVPELLAVPGVRLGDLRGGRGAGAWPAGRRGGGGGGRRRSTRDGGRGAGPSSARLLISNSIPDPRIPPNAAA